MALHCIYETAPKGYQSTECIYKSYKNVHNKMLDHVEVLSALTTHEQSTKTIYIV